MIFYKTKKGYYYKQYKNENKVRISEKEFNNKFKMYGSGLHCFKRNNELLLELLPNNGNNNENNNILLTFLKINYHSKTIEKLENLNLHIDNNYVNQNNFMEFKLLPNEYFNNLILNENFYLDNKVIFVNVNLDAIFEYTKRKFLSNFSKYNTRRDIQLSCITNTIIFSSSRPSERNHQYKLHISFNPNYTNNAFEILFESNFYKYYLKKFKIFYPNMNHYYKSTSDWKIFDLIKNNPRYQSKFYGGIGYLVIYLTRDNLGVLKEFIEYWKENFENNEDKYRDNNYIKFNVRLTKTLYFGYGSDTRSKLKNKYNESFQIYTKKHSEYYNQYRKLLQNDPNRAKRILKNTFGINNAEKNLLDNFKYWSNKNSNNINILKHYGINIYT